MGQKHKSAICDRKPPHLQINLVYMCAGGFRGHKSSNRIELSRLVQDLLNFGVLGSQWLWGWEDGWMGMGLVGGCPHTCAHTCTCMRGKHLQLHNNRVQIAASWIYKVDNAKTLCTKTTETEV